MFIKCDTGRPAFLEAQDENGVTFTDGARRHTVGAFEFFSTHREASSDEIAAHGAPPRQAARSKAAPKAKAARSARKAKAAPAPPAAAPAEAAPPAVAAKPAEAPPTPTVRVEPLG